MEHWPDVRPLMQSHFQLFVTGRDARTAVVEQQLRRFCARLAGPIRIEVIDLLVDPEYGDSLDIVATPLTIRRFPLPEIRVVGDLSDADRLAAAFGLDLDHERD